MEGEDGNPVPESIDVSQVEDSSEFWGGSSEFWNSIKIEQMIQIPYCNPQKNLKLVYSISGKNIEIQEIYETESECTLPICSVYLWGQIDYLEKGNYILTFVFEDKYNNQTRILAEKEFYFY